MRFLFLASLALSVPALADGPRAGVVRVRIVTSAGAIVLALDAAHAPATTANFLRYVDDQRFAGAAFYRVVERKGLPPAGFIQGGIRVDARRMLEPVKHEPTSRTGIRHTDGTISMARFDQPNSAAGNFFIVVGSLPTFDARPGNPGYAAFGHVVSGMDVVRSILKQPVAMRPDGSRGQQLRAPVRILGATRLDGVARPSGQAKPWLIGPKR
ncbi:MAG: peptidylprolyl isomerase [Sphingomonas taxi]